MLEPGRELEIGDEAAAQDLLLPSKAAGSDLWSGAYGADLGMRELWDRLREAWLQTKEHKSGSRHTRRSYETATVDWFNFLAGLRMADGRTVQPWAVTTDHVRLWQVALQQRGLAPGTVNQRMAACSSFYSFVANERGLVNGIEVTAFMDASGKLRMNPFSGGNVQRVRTSKYGKARVLTTDETAALLSWLESKAHTLAGLRNQALLLTYLMTGYRNQEVVAMRWRAIRPNRNQPGAWVIAWQGKGGKQEVDPLPLRVYTALVAYLKRAGYDPATMLADEFIFKPLITHNMKYLNNAKPNAAAEGHLSNRSAQRILHTALTAAGVAHPEQVRVHDLRHTFAHRFRKRNPDLEALRGRLHHESLSTTGIYVREVLEDPVDDYSEELYQSLLR